MIDTASCHDAEPAVADSRTTPDPAARMGFGANRTHEAFSLRLPRNRVRIRSRSFTFRKPVRNLNELPVLEKLCGENLREDDKIRLFLDNAVRKG